MVVRWSIQQLQDYNKRTIAGQQIEIVSISDVNDYSIEKAEVAVINDAQTFYKPGDKVAIDYSVFTHGLNPEMQQTSVSRFLFEHEGYRYYWCYDGTRVDSDGRPIESTEVFGIYVPAGPVFSKSTFLAHPDLVFIRPDESTGGYTQAEGNALWVPDKEDRDTKPFKSIVVFSGHDDVPVGTTIWVQPGLSVGIKFDARDISVKSLDLLGNPPVLELEYVESRYILGMEAYLGKQHKEFCLF